MAKIKIKKSKKGTFTKAAKKRGMSVQGFAKLVLANKSKYSPSMVKKANFAKNSTKWKHQKGGKIDLQLTNKVIKPLSPYRFTATPIKQGKTVKGVNANANYNITPNLSVSGGINQDVSNLSFNRKINTLPTNARQDYSELSQEINNPNLNLRAKYNVTPNLKVSSGLNTNFKDPNQYNISASYDRGPVGFAGRYDTDSLGNKNLNLEGRQQIGKNTNLSGNYNTDFNNSNRLSVNASQKLGPVKLRGNFNTDFNKDNKLGVGLNTKLGDKVDLNAGINTDFKNTSGNVGLNWRPNNRLNVKGRLGYNSDRQLSGAVGMGYNTNTHQSIKPKKLFQKGGEQGPIIISRSKQVEDNEDHMGEWVIRSTPVPATDSTEATSNISLFKKSGMSGELMPMNHQKITPQEYKGIVRLTPAQADSVFWSKVSTEPIKKQKGGSMFPDATSYQQVGTIPNNRLNYTPSTMSNRVGAPVKNYRDKGLFQEGGDINSGNSATTEEEFKNGLNDGVNVFKFPSKGLKKMTMNPESGPIDYPVDYKGYTDGKETDQGTALPGQDFNVNGDTVVETPNLSEMDFPAAFAYANKNKLPIFRWGENDYPIKKHMKHKKLQEGGLFSNKVTNKTKLDPGFKPEENIN